MRIIFFALILLTMPLHAANAQQLAIISPPDGALYHFGDTITVEVDQPNGGLVVLGADLHFNVSPRQINQAPYTFTVTIPPSTAVGTYTLSAISSATPPAKNPAIASINIKVEPNIPANGATLEVSPDVLQFTFAGQKKTVNIYLNDNGSQASVGYSPQLSAISNDTSIVSVQGVNLIAGPKGGSTSVRFELTGVSVNLPVNNITSGIRGDLNGDGRVDIDDLNILRAAINTPANGPNDARDLNHDGKIDALDARILTTLCTYPRCATQP